MQMWSYSYARDHEIKINSLLRSSRQNKIEQLHQMQQFANAGCRTCGFSGSGKPCTAAKNVQSALDVAFLALSLCP